MSKIEFKTKIIKISHVSLLTSFFLGLLFFTGLVQPKAFAQSIDEVIVTARQQSESKMFQRQSKLSLLRKLKTLQ